MNELDQALVDVQMIRRQVAQSTSFQGYGPLTLSATALLGAGAAGVQAVWIPMGAMLPYLALWVSTAVLACACIGAEMYGRTRRIHSGLANEMLLMAVEQFLPAVGTGALVTLVLYRFAPASLWLLPGLWQVISALGIFASSRFLPRGMALVAAWYVLSGLVAMSLGGSRALAPWTMGLGYGVGQLLFAAVLLRARREPTHGV